MAGEAACDLIQRASLTPQHGFKLEAGGDGGIARRGQVLRLGTQRGAGLGDSGLGILRRIGQRVEPGGQQIARNCEAAADGEIEQAEPEEGERCENTSDKNGNFMRQQEEKVVPADLLADVIGCEPKPEDACRNADDGDQSELLFR